MKRVGEVKRLNNKKRQKTVSDKEIGEKR